MSKYFDMPGVRSRVNGDLVVIEVDTIEGTKTFSVPAIRAVHMVSVIDEAVSRIIRSKHSKNPNQPPPNIWLQWYDADLMPRPNPTWSVDLVSSTDIMYVRSNL